MSLTVFEAMKRHSGFDAESEDALRTICPRIRGRFQAVVDHFYARILSHPGTARVLESPQQVERLKLMLLQWLTEVFLGPHDASYFEKRTRIGLTHVRIGLNQAYVFTAMSHIRSELERSILSELGSEQELARRGLDALSKILDIDLALIASSYHEAEKYQDLVEFAPDMIHQVDRQGRILTVNRTEQKCLGYPAAELLAKHLEDIVHPEDREAIRRHLTRVFSEGQNRCEARFLTASGEALDVEIHATGVRDPITGAVIHTRAYVRDISERKKHEAELLRERDTAQRYLDVAGAIICAIGQDEKLELMNRKGCEILGYDEAELLGRSFLDIVPNAHKEELRRVFRELMAGKIEAYERYEGPILTRGGEERIIEWRITILRDPDGTITGTLSSGIDITDRKSMERALVEQASLARLGELAAVVAHEVKNPLAGIGGALQVIERQLPLEGSGRAMVKEILERLEALNNTVNDILLFARPRLPRLVPVPVLSLVQDTFTLLLQDPKLSKFRVETSGEDAVATADPELLKPVILNLLLNAAQAVGPTGKVSVHVARSSKCCSLLVKDNGPGIPLAIREKIFEPFFSTKHRGTGLGLPIAKRIVEAHGGQIRIECPREGGTTVVVDLPLGAEPGG